MYTKVWCRQRPLVAAGLQEPHRAFLADLYPLPGDEPEPVPVLAESQLRQLFLASLYEVPRPAPGSPHPTLA